MRIPNQKTSSTLLSEVAEPQAETKGLGAKAKLLAQGFFFTAVGVSLTHLAGFEQAGVLSIFLAAAALAEPYNELLAENRDAIWSGRETSWSANRRTAVGLLSLFLGMCLAFALTAAILGEVRMERTFGFAIETAGLRSDTILTRRFGSFQSLLGHNLVVLLSFATLALIYRGYGAVIALSWNAVIWSVVLTVLVQRGIGPSGVSPVLFVLVSTLSVLPHLALEALAFVIGSMAAIFISKGITKYGFRDPKLKLVAKACAALMTAAVIALIAAAAIERTLPPLALALFKP
jgi:hypothetical protein